LLTASLRRDPPHQCWFPPTGCPAHARVLTTLGAHAEASRKAAPPGPPPARQPQVPEVDESSVLAEYPDATIQRVENDADGDAYEAHILQADGTRATVKLDETFAVTGTETGGHGGGHHGDHAEDNDSTSTDDSSTSGT
jgi:hypothetical protein